MDVKNTIRAFLEQRVGKDKTIADEDDIFARGLVNSLFALELVTFLENSFRITVENEDLDLNNFSRIAAMAAFVERKRSQT